MALDVGERRIGVAVTDPLRLFARPIATLQRRDPATTLAELAALVREWDVARIVIGHPLLPSGDRGSSALAVEALVAAWGPELGVPVELWDESYSTVEAAARLRARGKDARRAKGEIDAEAAAVILEEWLQAQPGESLPAQSDEGMKAQSEEGIKAQSDGVLRQE